MAGEEAESGRDTERSEYQKGCLNTAENTHVNRLKETHDNGNIHKPVLHWSSGSQPFLSDAGVHLPLPIR